jgi:phosphohistidine phosphatase SixA
MKTLKAVYAKGKVVTGVTHGDAFSKLTEEEKKGQDFVIGDWCPDTGLFEGDGKLFFTKKVLLIRHAEPRFINYTEDFGLSDRGMTQAKLLGSWLAEDGWGNVDIFTSPAKRCQLTAGILNLFLLYDGNGVTVDPRLAEGCTSQDNIIQVLENLPQKSIIISHSPFIQAVVLLLSSVFGNGEIPLASMTLIDNENVVYLGKGIPQK